MARPLQDWSPSRLLTMDNQNYEPPTVRKTISVSGSRSVSSSMSYPYIPRRRSSLSASLSNDSNGPATSTRTPSLCDSLYRIEVMKRRQSGGRILRGMGNMDHGSMGDDPFVDEVAAPLSSSAAILLTCKSDPTTTRRDEREQYPRQISTRAWLTADGPLELWILGFYRTRSSVRLEFYQRLCGDETPYSRPETTSKVHK